MVPGDIVDRRITTNKVRFHCFVTDFLLAEFENRKFDSLI